MSRMKTDGARALALASLMIPAACAPHRTVSANANPPVPVRSAIVSGRALTSTLRLAGSIESSHAVSIGAVSPGRVADVNVRVGDRVEAGEVVASVDASGYSAQLAQAQSGAQAAAAQTSVAQAQVAAAAAGLRLARVTEQRMARLYREGAISHQDYDQSQTALASAIATEQQARAGAASADAAAQAARSGAAAAAVPVADAVVRAPFSGVVTARFVEPGAVVGAGVPVVAIDDESHLEMQVAVPNDVHVALSRGQALNVRVDALPGVPLHARVLGLAPSNDSQLRSMSLRVGIDPAPGLAPGMYGTVTIPRREQGLAVPASAVVTRAGQSGVFEIDGNVARFLPLELGSPAQDYVTVHDPSLRGKRVITSNLQSVTDGTVVSTL